MRDPALPSTMKTCQHCGRTHPITDKCPVTQALMMAPGPCGSTVGGYRVLHWLGGGGIGTVYAAQDPRTGATVALKLLRAGMGSSVEKLARFEREARLAAQVGSDHIVRVIEFGYSPDGRAFLAMELLEGSPLDSFIKEHAPLPVQDAVDIAIQVLDALAAAHTQGIVHRDLKPANLFLSRTATKRHFVKVLDFGLSKLIDDHDRPKLTRTGALLGTPRYMAPEQISDPHRVDHRADIHAIGVILFQMLTRQFPYEGKGIEGVLVALATSQPTSLSRMPGAFPAQLVVAVDRALARDPSKRWPTAREFSAALRRLDLEDDDFPLDGPTVASASPTQAREIREAVRRSLEPVAAYPAAPTPGAQSAAPVHTDHDDDDASVSTAQLGSMVPATARAAMAAQSRLAPDPSASLDVPPVSPSPSRSIPDGANDYDEMPPTRVAPGRPPAAQQAFAPPSYGGPHDPAQSRAAHAPMLAPSGPSHPGSVHPPHLAPGASTPVFAQPAAPPANVVPRDSTRWWIAIALTVPVVIGVVVALIVTR